MRALKAVGVLLAGPILGFLVGAYGFGLTLPPDPAPGDGIGMILCGFMTALAFFTVSAALAVRLARRPSLKPAGFSKPL